MLARTSEACLSQRLSSRTVRSVFPQTALQYVLIRQVLDQLQDTCVRNFLHQEQLQSVRP